MARSNLSKKYMIQGPDGPVEAKRPSDDVLRQLNDLPWRERLSMAIALAKDGFTIDAAVDVFDGNYWKLMAGRRNHKPEPFAWIPAGDMANLLIAPGLSQPGTPAYDPNNPPQGAILVPASEQDDPNFKPPETVTPPAPPPSGVVSFDQPIEVGEFAGSFRVGIENTVPVGTHATKDGAEYVYVDLPRGFTGSLRLWIPIGG